MQAIERGPYHPIGHLLHEQGRGKRHGRNAAHAACIGSSIGRPDPLIVFGLGQQAIAAPIGEDKHGHLDALHAIFYQYLLAGGTELGIGKHGSGSRLRLGHCGGHHHAFARRKPIGFHHYGGTLPLYIGKGSVQLRGFEKGRRGSRHAKILHKLLAEHLAAL